MFQWYYKNKSERVKTIPVLDANPAKLKAKKKFYNNYFLSKLLNALGINRD